MKIINFNMAKAYKFTSKIICFIMIAMAIVNLASCEKKYETTTVSGYVYLSDGGILQGATVELMGNLQYSSESYPGVTVLPSRTSITETMTNRDGYYEVKFDKDYKTYMIYVGGGQTTSGKRWHDYYNYPIQLVLGENNTVNIYLQLY